MKKLTPTSEQADLIPRLCDYIHAHIATPEKLTLAALSEAFNYDGRHLQSLFRQALGVTPRQYADAYRTRRFKAELREQERVTDAIFTAGYASPSRVYEHAATKLGMTPAQYQQCEQKDETMPIFYAHTESDMGLLQVAVTERGLCGVGFHADAAEAIDALQREYPQATLHEDADALRDWVRDVLATLDGEQRDLPLDVQATAFQWRVWDALRRIPRGETRTYGEVAREIGQPGAARAVARACSQNPLAVVVPCHRVIGADGKLRGYRWNIACKAQLLERERQPVSES